MTGHVRGGRRYGADAGVVVGAAATVGALVAGIVGMDDDGGVVRDSVGGIRGKGGVGG